MQLIDGADAIAGDLPAAVTRRVEVPLGAGESLGSGVARLSALRSVRDSVEIAVAAMTAPDARTDDDAAEPAIVVTIGGDCGVELAPISAALERAAQHGGTLAVLWLDAHADLGGPSEGVPGSFSGMVLRTLLGDGSELLVPEHPLPASQVVLAGVRSVDDDEEAYIAEAGIARVDVDALAEQGALVAALEATGATEVYVHVDLDVLDPAEIAAISFPEPFGVSVGVLAGAIQAVRRRFPLAGAGITQFAPSSPDAASDDLSAVLRVISALTRSL
ncbi:arginase [Subtercola sp. Z020]|nr:arginase [Subtercola sp. Z020]